MKNLLKKYDDLGRRCVAQDQELKQLRSASVNRPSSTSRSSPLNERPRTNPRSIDLEVKEILIESQLENDKQKITIEKLREEIKMLVDKQEATVCESIDEDLVPLITTQVYHIL
jgi:hypothetical protein